MAKLSILPDEIQMNISNRVRAFFLGIEELQQPVEGFTIKPEDGRMVELDYPAINWRTVRLEGIDGEYQPLSTQDGHYRSYIELTKPQTTEVFIPPFSRYSSLILISPDDAPASFSRYFSYQKKEKVPLLLILFRMDDAMTRNDGELLYVDAKGVLAMHGPPDEEGMYIATEELDKIVQAIQGKPEDLKFRGIHSIEMGDYNSHTFGVFSEVSVDITARIVVNIQEDNYWTGYN